MCARTAPVPGLSGYTLGALSALNTSLALRQAIWTKPDPAWPMCGVPEILYVDHGSDFISDHLAQVAADLKFAIVHSTVARPRGRGKVERLFGSINTELLTELPGHLDHGKPVTAPTLSLRQLDEAIRRYRPRGAGVHRRTEHRTPDPPARRGRSRLGRGGRAIVRRPGHLVQDPRARA
ncbi:hypothetical protein ACFZC5_19015 [Nocardia gamkensis]|uniref:hypothetical protein n=1 Tax=Nocardia gamkensis TaxID=352869 RepID=UPI0036EA273C